MGWIPTFAGMTRKVAGMTKKIRAVTRLRKLKTDRLYFESKP
jgi:hypothetical protein